MLDLWLSAKIKAPKGEETGSRRDLISTLPSALFTGTNSTHQLRHHQAEFSPSFLPLSGHLQLLPGPT